MSSKTNNSKHIPGKYHAPSVVKLDNHVTPIFKEVRGEDWVFLGVNNDYADYLIKLYDRSAKHAAIVKSKVNYTTGAGWGYDAKDLDEQQTLNAEAFINLINPDGETLKDVTMKCDEDKKIFGGFYLEVIWDKKGGKPASIKHVPFRKIRSNKDNTTFYYSSSWIVNGKQNRDIVGSEDFATYPAFDPVNPKGAQILFYKTYHPALDVYPLPEYLGAISNIETDIEISNYHYNNVKNGFAGTFMVNFLNGTPLPEEQKDIEKKFKEKFTGTDNAGSFILNFADGKEKAAEILPIGMTNADKMFLELTKWVQEEIFTGHRITSPMLFGIKTEGQLGGRSEMVEAYELFKNVYVKPEQLQIEYVFNILARLSGVTTDLYLNEAEPIAEQLSENTLAQILTKNELRLKSGYPELDTKASANATADAINSLSPLVANKVLSSLTTNEIRQLAGLAPQIGGDVIPADAPAATFSKQNTDYLPLFDKYGTPKDQFNIINKRFVHHFTRELALESELSIAKGYFYTSNERAIIDLLDKNPLMSPSEIAAIIKKPLDYITKTIKSLVDDGILKVGKSEQGAPLNEVTPEGKTTIEESPAKTAEIFVLYEYAWAPGFNQSMIDTSRDFCKELLAKEKLYTREEIEAISAEAGEDVWMMRGGWYTKPGTTIHIPHCRHIWQQNIVTKKS